MIDNAQSGLIEKPNVTDHQFAQFARKHGLIYRHFSNATYWTDKHGDNVAVIIFDNARCTRKIFIKEGLT